MSTWKKVRSRDSSVGVACGYGLDYRQVGVPVPVGSMDTGAVSPRVKRQGREAYHSPPASAEVSQENVGLYIHTHIRLHGVVLN
jgi:hypothetical protein